jgi:uncharacterized membrane protein
MTIKSGEIMQKNNRAFELDALRGLALFLMICHHAIFDFRYLLEINIFAFQETDWFNYILQPVFLCVFLAVSGICCQFSRNNLRRSLKLLILALVFSIAMALFSQYSNQDLYVFFNILHLLTVGTFLFGLLSLWEERRNRKTMEATVSVSDSSASEDQADIVPLSSKVDIALIILASSLILSDQLRDVFRFEVQSYWLLPLGFLPKNYISMGDYLPILPWLGFFFVGVVIGRIGYRGKHTLFPRAPKAVKLIARPFEWFGRNSLIIYLVHQPIILAILYGLRYLGVW